MNRLLPAFLFLSLVVMLGAAEIWAHKGFMPFLKTGGGVVCVLLILYGIAWMLLSGGVR